MMNTRFGAADVEESGRMSLQERKQEFARNAIWDAAIDLFFEKGFDETTVDEIAEAAGTSRRSFFRHFESKNDLMAQPVIEWGISLVKAIDAAPSTLSTPDLLREVVFKVSQESASNPRSRKLMEIAAKFPAAREAQLSRFAGVQDRLAQAFGRRCKDDITPHLMAGLIFTVLSATHQYWFEKREKDISDTAHKAFAALSKIVCDIEHSNSKEPSRRAGKG
jgi:AcrR family transcriptional regulator